MFSHNYATFSFHKHTWILRETELVHNDKKYFLSRITQNKVLQKINTKKTKLKLLKIPIKIIVNIICPSHTSALLMWTMLTFGSYGPPPHLGIEFYWNIMISSCRETNLFLCLCLVLHRLRAESFGTLSTMVSCKHWHPKTKCQNNFIEIQKNMHI
jgi:hypothetical protein